MKLRSRILILFLLGAVVPIGLTAWITRQFIADSYETDYRQSITMAKSQIKAELERVRTDTHRRVSVVASMNNPVLGGFVYDVQKNRGNVSGEALQTLREKSISLQQNFPVFYLLDPSGMVWMSLHNAGEFHDRKPELLGSDTQKSFFRWIRVQEDGAMKQRLAILSRKRIRSGQVEFVVVAGRTLTRDQLAHIETSDAMKLSLDQGTAVAEERDWAGGHATLDLADDTGKTQAQVSVVLSDRELKAILERVTLLAAAGIVLAIFLISLIAILVSRGVTRDLEQLVEAANHVAQGNLEHQVPPTKTKEISQVGATFNDMTTELRDSKQALVTAERVAAWRDVARQLAHEIKNPLTPIKMSVETLRRTWQRQHPKFEEIFEESTNTVLTETERLRRTLDEFSKFAQMPKPNFSEIDLNSLVGKVTSLYQECPITLTLADDLPTVNADRDQISQVLYNLIENARDANSQAGHAAAEIRVATSAGRAFVELFIEDDGAGIAENQRDKIFDPYYTTKAQRGGSGLGLAVVHRIISDHGGSIVASPSVGGTQTGARFRITFPVPPKSASRSSLFSLRARD